MNTYGPLILLSIFFAIILGVQVFVTLYLGYDHPKRIKDTNEPEPTVISTITPSEHKS